MILFPQPTNGPWSEEGTQDSTLGLFQEEGGWV